MDYSKTVNLPKTDFPMKADLPKREPAMLEQWEKEKIYEKALERRKGKKKFVLHDGPPYANGHLHLGHALNKILKDMIVRCKTMAGYYAPYVPGWDCHGLPIELALMKEQKIDKSQIDRKKFRADASAYASKFVEIQKQEFKRMGILGEWDHPYLTMAGPYKETIVEVFEALKKEGYIFKGKKPVYWCCSDETALAALHHRQAQPAPMAAGEAFRDRNRVNLHIHLGTVADHCCGLCLDHDRFHHVHHGRRRQAGRDVPVRDFPDRREGRDLLR